MGGISQTAVARSTSREAQQMRRRHAVQRALVAAIAPLWIPLAIVYFRFVRGYRIRDLARVRADYARLRAESRRPLLVCANHLTLIDSFIVGWALRSPWGYLRDFDSFPWNTPERTNFAGTRLHSVLVYLAKCIPITRGGRREDTGAVLDRVAYLLERGEVALLFPEGGRSRTGRVEVDAGGAWGVGRVVGATADCRVLCVYLRGDAQATWSAFPAKGDVFSIALACIEPKSDERGARRSRDLAGQIVAKLAAMEREYLDDRQ